MIKHLNIIFLVATLMLISSCMSNAHRAHIRSQSADPAVRTSTLAMKLKQQGVQIINVGETITIVMASDFLFKGDSANLDHGSFYRLNLVADFLNIYSKTFVEVAGYTGYLENPSLASRQAASIAKYLWSKGIDARMLYAVGYGSGYSISNNDSASGRAKNRRIEIHFQY